MIAEEPKQNVSLIRNLCGDTALGDFERAVLIVSVTVLASP
jgi:hypothetical protein